MIAVTLTEQQKKWGKWAGYPLFALFVFVYAMHLSFPYERIEEKLREFAGEGFDVRVDSAGPGWFPGDVVLKGVQFKTRPAREGDKPVELNIDRIDIDLGLFAALRKTTDIEVEAIVGDGRIEGHVIASKDEVTINVSSHELPLEGLPGIQTATGGVPMAGGISLAIDVTLPKNKWRDANGTMTIDCDGCTIGDGKAKIRPQGQGQQNAFSDGGFTLPRLKLGKIGGKIKIAKGQGHFEEFTGKSPDGELYLDGDIRFEDPFVKSQVTAYMRFKANDELVKREEKMGDIINMMKGQSLRPEDGLMGLKITGPFNALRFLGSKISPVQTKDQGGAKDGVRPRPSVGLGRGIGEEQRPQVNMTPPPAIQPSPSPVETAPPPPQETYIPPPISGAPPPQPPPQQPIEAAPMPGEMPRSPDGDVRQMPNGDVRQMPTNESDRMPPPPPPSDYPQPMQPPDAQQVPPPTNEYGQPAPSVD